MTADPQIRIFPDADALAEAVADAFIKIATDAITQCGRFIVSLSGGSTPKRLYHLLATVHKNSLDWSKAVFLFGDERDVPPDHDASNFRMANETLLKPIAACSSQIHRWQTELGDRQETARIYNETIRSLGQSLDLCLLGLGDDCHTASLFPHSEALNEDELLAVANHVRQLDEWRYTMTLPAINASRNVMFLVAGSGKAAAVDAVLMGKTDTDARPAQAVKPDSGRLFWFIDAAAAARLEHG
ncbi:6-phosphogluconolactonase [soil metagenome]